MMSDLRPDIETLRCDLEKSGIPQELALRAAQHFSGVPPAQPLSGNEIKQVQQVFVDWANPKTQLSFQPLKQLWNWCYLPPEIESKLMAIALITFVAAFTAGFFFQRAILPQQCFSKPEIVKSL